MSVETLRATFSPLSVARQVLAETDLVEPAEIADAVFARTPAGEVEAAYRLLLRDVAREAIRFERMRVQTSLGSHEDDGSHSHIAPEGSDFPQGQTDRGSHFQPALGGQSSPTSHSRLDAHTAVAGGGRKPNRSGRLAAIRDRHAAWKRARYVIDGTWKMLADCTVDDVLALAAQRRDVAARNTAEAERFDQLARVMKDAGAVTVADLDDDVEVAA